MFRAFLTQFEWRAALLFQGRYDDLARHYRLPLDAQLLGQRLHISHRDDMALHLRRHHVALLRHQVTGLAPEILALDLHARPEGQRVWLRWHPQGGDLPPSQVAYLMQPGAIIAGMVYSRLSMPEFGQGATHRRLVV